MVNRSLFGRCGLILVGALAGSAAGQVPANDLCDNATVLSLESGCGTCTLDSEGRFVLNGSTTTATIDGSAPACGGAGNTSKGVWFRLVGRGNQVIINTQFSTGAFFDTQIAVFCGSCSALSCVTYNDDVNDTEQGSEVRFCANAGATYWVLVNGVGSQGGSFGLHFGEIRDLSGSPLTCCEPYACSNACTFVIPPGAELENGWNPGPTGPYTEEVCNSDGGSHPDVHINDGCSTPGSSDRPYGTIAIGQTRWGHIWGNSGARDRDWFVFESMPSGSSLVRYAVSTEGPVQFRGVFNNSYINFYSCAPSVSFLTTNLPGCGRTLERIAVMDGSATGPSGETPGNTIGFALSAPTSSGYPCGTNTQYWLTLHEVVSLSACPPIEAPPQAQDEATLPTFDGTGGNDGFTAGEPCYDADPDGGGPDRAWRKEGCSSSPITNGEFLRLTPNIPILGRITSTLSSSGAARDIDYYKFQLANRSVVSLRVDASGPMVALLTDNSCTSNAVAYATAATRGRCLPESWVEVPDLTTLDAGTYIVAVFMSDAFVEMGQGSIFGQISCGDPISSYVVSLEADPLPACGLSCPPDAVVENEPCTADPAAMFAACTADNDGCSRSPFTSINLPFGAPACGTLFSTYVPESDGDPASAAHFEVDQDYWSFSVPVRSSVTFSAAADGPVRVQLLHVGAGGGQCDAGSAPILAEIDAGACVTGDGISIEIGPGEYALAAAPGSVEIGLSVGEYSCGEHLSYTLTASSVPACCTGNADHESPGQVDFADITAVLAGFGLVDASGLAPGDADCNGVVNFADITAVLTHFGAGCS